MTRSASRRLQGQLKELARNRLSVETFSKHVQTQEKAYRLEDAILALNGLQLEGVLPTEEMITSQGLTARAVEKNAAYAPVKHGLNMLLWEQVIRKGDLTKQEKQKVRDLYIAHAHYSLFRPTDNESDLTRRKSQERWFQEKALDLAETDRFEHIRDTAIRVSKQVREALNGRPDSAHRQVMNSAFLSFSDLLSHLNDSREFKDDMRKALNQSAKDL